jgi:1,4-alpha-glucan branching enzyme
MGIPDYWIKLLKHTRDEDWNIDELWGVLTNRRPGENTIAYAESHDQALVGDKTLAFHLMDQDMYWHMKKDDPHPVIERGIALHKLIRIATLAFGGEGWLNFMGNEFGHPEWLDFPREGNGWSYHYCRRQWSLVDHPELKYQHLAAFDRALMDLVRQHKLLSAPPAKQLWVDHDRKILCAERAGLIFVLNFSVTESVFGFPLPVPTPETRKLILDSDSPTFGGHNRIDHSFTYPTNPEGIMKLYTPNRTALVFAPI